MGTQAQFHAALAALAGNTVLEITMQLFGQIVSHHAVVAGDPTTPMNEVFHDHVELARAVRSGHPRVARRVMENHVTMVVDYLQQRPELARDRLVAWI